LKNRRRTARRERLSAACAAAHAAKDAGNDRDGATWWTPGVTGDAAGNAGDAGDAKGARKAMALATSMVTKGMGNPWQIRICM
jgi:hypothetical protein